MWCEAQYLDAALYGGVQDQMRVSGQQVRILGTASGEFAWHRDAATVVVVQGVQVKIRPEPAGSGDLFVPAGTGFERHGSMVRCRRATVKGWRTGRALRGRLPHPPEPKLRSIVGIQWVRTPTG